MLIFVRHAESENNRHYHELLRSFGRDYEGFNAAYDLVRESDPPLSELGERQAEKLAEALAPILQEHSPRALLVTSPMRRAIQTASALAQAAEIEHMACHLEFFEQGSGILRREERPSQLAARLTKEHPLFCFETLTDASYPQRGRGESETEFRVRVDRVIAWLEDMLEFMIHDVIVIVAHGGLLSRLLRRWMRIPIGRGATFRHGNAGFTTVHWDPLHGIMLDGLNQLSHLPAEMRPARSLDGWWGYGMPGVRIRHYEQRSKIPPDIDQALDPLRELWPFDDESDEGDTHLVLHSAQLVCGYAQFTGKGVLHRLVIRKDSRGQGLGAYLLCCVELLMEAERAELKVSREASGFFAHHGWGEIWGDEGDEAAGLMKFEKYLFFLDPADA